MTDFDRELWERVDTHREFIQEKYGKYPIVTSLEDAFQSAHGKDITDDILDRENRPATSVFAAAMYYIEVGLYPPPEIMLTLVDCWREYLDGFDFERAFLGRPKQKVGNFAKRRQREARDLSILLHGMELVNRKGKTLEQAAEIIHTNLEQFGVTFFVDEPKKKVEPGAIPSVESIVRMLTGRLKRNKPE